jgi:hypothetical protein
MQSECDTLAVSALAVSNVAQENLESKSDAHNQSLSIGALTLAYTMTFPESFCSAQSIMVGDSSTYVLFLSDAFT